MVSSNSMIWIKIQVVQHISSTCDGEGTLIHISHPGYASDYKVSTPPHSYMSGSQLSKTPFEKVEQWGRKLRVVHKERPQRSTCFLPRPMIPNTPLLSACGLPPLQTSASSIRCCSTVWQCNRRCSQNMLLMDLIITTCNSKQRQNQQRLHVNNLTPGARPM